MDDIHQVRAPRLHGGWPKTVRAERYYSTKSNVFLNFLPLPGSAEAPVS